MKHILTAITGLLISFSAIGVEVLWLPFCVPQAYMDNPAKKQDITDGACEFAGMPKTEENWQAIKKILKFSPRTNVVGNVELGVPPGSDWWVSCNAAENIFGVFCHTNTWKYEVTTNDLTNVFLNNVLIDLDERANNLSTNSAGQWMLVGKFNANPEGTFNYWGVVSQTNE